jgi:hypothetical protein
MAANSGALSLYKKILRIGRSWPVSEEREYIKTEAQQLFRQNRGLKNPEYATKVQCLPFLHSVVAI